MTQSKIDLYIKVVIGALLALLAWLIVDTMQEHIVVAGDTAPNFKLTADNGRQFTPRDFGGKVLVLNFWASWCPPCVQEIPSLNEFQKMFAADGVVVLGVSVDHNEKNYRTMVKNFKIVFPTVRDPEENVSYKYGTYKVPESYIIDRNGKVVRKFIGLPEQDGVAKLWTAPEIVGLVKSLL
jgi:cytochrome c biogenesis protein CcmG, thiol:disulfide interchange protein DsbE